MSIRTSHKWRKKPGNLIWLLCSIKHINIYRFEYKRYENGRRNFHMFMEKWIHMPHMRVTRYNVDPPEKFIRYYYRNNSIDKTVRISKQGFANSHGHHIGYMTQKQLEKRLKKKYSQNCQTISKVESAYIEIMKRYTNDA